MVDVIIIGNGPAGISASLYVQRANLKSLVIGKDGGALEKTDKIDNYYGFAESISGRELLANGKKQARRLGAELLEDEVVGLDYNGNFIVKTKSKNYECVSLIMATGTSRKTPEIKGIKKYEGKGISYCAVCDAFFYRKKDVAVLGGGDYAVHEAMELLPVVNSVTMLTNGKEHVEYRDSNLVINEKPIREFRGAETIHEVEFEDHTKLSVDGVFVAIGTATSSDLARKIGANTDGKNILVDENMQTNIPGLYACGDCTGGLLQIAKAVYEGAKAGIEAIKFVRKK